MSLRTHADKNDDYTTRKSSLEEAPTRTTFSHKEIEKLITFSRGCNFSAVSNAGLLINHSRPYLQQLLRALVVLL